MRRYTELRDFSVRSNSIDSPKVSRKLTFSAYWSFLKPYLWSEITYSDRVLLVLAGSFLIIANFLKVGSSLVLKDAVNALAEGHPAMLLVGLYSAML